MLGSAADSTVLTDARKRGFSTPSGLVDLGDAGYALAMEAMTPYRGVRCHLKEWAQGNERYVSNQASTYCLDMLI